MAFQMFDARWLRYGDPLAGYRPKGAAQAWIMAHADHAGDECLPWPFGQSKKGYPSNVTLDGHREAAHRAMCRAAHGDPPSPKHQAAHTCCRRGCIHPQHLHWATVAAERRSAA
jgi:hypothetical protein